MSFQPARSSPAAAARRNRVGLYITLASFLVGSRPAAAHGEQIVVPFILTTGAVGLFLGILVVFPIKAASQVRIAAFTAVLVASVLGCIAAGIATNVYVFFLGPLLPPALIGLIIRTLFHRGRRGSENVNRV